MILVMLSKLRTCAIYIQCAHHLSSGTHDFHQVICSASQKSLYTKFHSFWEPYSGSKCLLTYTCHGYHCNWNTRLTNVQLSFCPLLYIDHSHFRFGMTNYCTVPMGKSIIDMHDSLIHNKIIIFITFKIAKLVLLYLPSSTVGYMYLKPFI